MLLLPLRAQDAVKAGFRGQILPLIGQFRNNLAGREAGKFLAIADRQEATRLRRLLRVYNGTRPINSNKSLAEENLSFEGVKAMYR